MILGIILTIGIEIKCGMIGLGVIQAGILGVLLIDGHHLDMIDGDIICTMVGIIMVGDIITGWAMFIMEMVGITIMEMVGDTRTPHISTVEEELQLQEMVEHMLL
tara:strand:+ start:68 stop:382 length:315 start_codon:yes stop_codon:yes gene_type:complete